MELRHLRYFVAVAEELHFSRAAERLHISQPPLSQQIRQFEDELGVALFTRTRRSVRLTDAGRVILEDARRTLAQAAKIVLDARRAAQGEAGVLRLGFSGAAPYTTLPALLRAFRLQFPDIALSLFERSSEEQIELLASSVIDAGLIRLPVTNLPPSLVVRSIVREPLMVALSRGHRLARQRSVLVGALAHEPFIMFPRHVAPGLFDTIDQLCRAAGFILTVGQEAVQIQTIVSLVSAGLGVAIVPASLRNLQRARVVYRPLAPGNATTEMALAYDRDNPSTVLRTFIEVVAKLISESRKDDWLTG
jgi:DNA-binding transcriptional LysR family regulator